MNAAVEDDEGFCIGKLLFLLNFPESEVEPVGLFDLLDYRIETDEG